MAYIADSLGGTVESYPLDPPPDSAEYCEVTLIAPPHIMQPHSAPMNSDFPELDADPEPLDSGLTIEDTYLTITLPSNPNDLLNQGWVNVTDPRMAANSNRREFLNPDTGQRIAFDEGQPDARGWEGRDHYHIYNPSSTGKSDLYLDVDGNPTRRNSKQSHIPPGSQLPENPLP